MVNGRAKINVKQAMHLFALLDNFQEMCQSTCIYAVTQKTFFSVSQSNINQRLVCFKAKNLRR